MVKVRRVYYNGYLLTQFYYNKKWITVPAGSKGAAQVQVPQPTPQEQQLNDMQRQILEYELQQIKAGPTDTDKALTELANQAIAEQKRYLVEGPRPIPEAYRNTIRQSFDVARGDVTRDINQQFQDFLQTSRRELLGRGVGDPGSSYNTDISGYATREQAKESEIALSRLAAGQASAELSGQMDLANMVQQALSVSTGQLSQSAAQRIGLLSGAGNAASQYLSSDAARRLQMGIVNAQLAGQSGGMLDLLGGVGASASGALMGSILGSMVPGFGTAIGGMTGGLLGGASAGGLIGGLGGLISGIRRRY